MIARAGAKAPIVTSFDRVVFFFWFLHQGADSLSPDVHLPVLLFFDVCGNDLCCLDVVKPRGSFSYTRGQAEKLKFHRFRCNICCRRTTGDPVALTLLLCRATFSFSRHRSIASDYNIADVQEERKEIRRRKKTDRFANTVRIDLMTIFRRF